MNKDLLITKASGETALFSKEKLGNSLKRAGATGEQVEDIVEQMAERLYEGITTKKIYKMAFNLLKGNSRHLAAKYHLKQAIMELGPTGYTFEKFVGEMLAFQGYKVQVGVIVQGNCVQHEVDVLAKKENTQLLIECKYHNQSGIFCDVKIPLYIHSRFKDVEAQWLKTPTALPLSYQGWVVTNTRFSKDALQYGICAGLKLIGWDYPVKGSIKDLIDNLRLFPITCLTSLTKGEKQYLLDKKIVMCKDLDKNTRLLEQAGVKPARMDTVLQEIRQLCKNIDNNALPIDNN